MPMASSSQPQGDLILASSPGRPITAYDTLSGDVVAEFPAANTPRHGLAVAGPASIAASHVSPATAAGSVLLLQWCSPAAARSLPEPEPVAPIVATPHGSHLLAGGVSGRVHALALPSGDIARSFRAHRSAVSCLTLNDDGSLLVSGGDDGAVAVFPLIRILDIDGDNINDDNDKSAGLAIHRIAAHVAPVTCLACGNGGCNAILASGSADGTCKVWNLADGGHLRTLTYACTPLSLAIDPTTSYIYVGGSDGAVHVTFLRSHEATTKTWRAQERNNSSSSNVALVGVGVANECKNLVSCSEEGEMLTWDLKSGSITNSFRISGGVSDMLVVKRLSNGVIRGDGEVISGGFRLNDGEVWRRVKEVEAMEEMLQEAVEDKKRSVELVEMALDGYKRTLRLMLREVGDGEGNGSNPKEGD